MAKFCGKCGAPLNDMGQCPNCDKEPVSAVPQPHNEGDTAGQPPKKPDSKKTKKNKATTEKKKGRSKKVWIWLAVILAVIVVGIATLSVLVYTDTLDIPFVNGLFVSLGLKEGDDATPSTSDEGGTGQDPDSSTPTVSEDEDIDLGANYEVPAFDAEAYFRENTTLKSSFDAATSADVQSEDGAYSSFEERGFVQEGITCDYTMDGTYIGTTQISRYSSQQHPMYQTYYTTAAGDVWSITQVNGAFFATPVFYNFADETRVPVILSETKTITSYDSTANKFYVNIPNASRTVIKTVSKIDAETLEKLTGEVIGKL